MCTVASDSDGVKVSVIDGKSDSDRNDWIIMNFSFFFFLLLVLYTCCNLVAADLSSAQHQPILKPLNHSNLNIKRLGPKYQPTPAIADEVNSRHPGPKQKPLEERNFRRQSRVKRVVRR